MLPDSKEKPQTSIYLDDHLDNFESQKKSMKKAIGGNILFKFHGEYSLDTNERNFLLNRSMEAFEKIALMYFVSDNPDSKNYFQAYIGIDEKTLRIFLTSVDNNSKYAKILTHDIRLKIDFQPERAYKTFVCQEFEIQNKSLNVTSFYKTADETKPLGVLIEVDVAAVKQFSEGKRNNIQEKTKKLYPNSKGTSFDQKL